MFNSFRLVSLLNEILEKSQLKSFAAAGFFSFGFFIGSGFLKKNASSAIGEILKLLLFRPNFFHINYCLPLAALLSRYSRKIVCIKSP